MGLFVLIALLFVVMPGLLYLVGWGAKRFIDEPPSWIGFPNPGEEPSKKPDGEAPPKVEP